MMLQSPTPNSRHTAMYPKAGGVFEYTCPRCGGRLIRPHAVPTLVCWLCGHSFKGAGRRAASQQAK